jgi:hypothetical protein
LDLKELECAPSNSAKSIRSAAACSQSIGQASPVTETSEPLSHHQQTLFAEDSPAKTSAAPAQQEQESTESAPDSGQSTPALFASLDPNGSSWKTAQHCFIEDLGASSPIWPRSGMTQNGIAYELPPLEHRSLATESTFLPRPTRSMGKRGWGFAHTYGKGRYGGRVLNFALKFGWRPPADLLEWAMGFPISWTAGVAPKDSETQSSLSSQRSSGEQL